MRLLNKNQLNNLPVVEQGNMFLGEARGTAEAAQAIKRGYQQAARDRAVASHNQKRMASRNQAMGDAAAANHAAMLARSIKPNAKQQGLVLEAQNNRGNMMQGQNRFGVRSPGMGFIAPSAVSTSNTINSDFIEEEIYNAQEFNNCLTSDHFKGYKQYKDFPMVWDSPKGDFGGILTDERGSADFSTRIVNDAPNDFGYIPQRAAPRKQNPNNMMRSRLNRRK